MDFGEAVARIRIELTNRSWLRPPDLPRPVPRRLFHYTSQAGLMGIISSNVLWATNALYLNDATELIYGFSLAREHLGAFAGGSSVVREFVTQGMRLMDLPSLLPGREFYACCFCEDPDLLSQWRAYGGRGGGFALGFDTEDLSRAGSKQHLSLFPVEYGPGVSSERLSYDIKALCESLDSCTTQFPTDEAQLVSAACENLRMMLVLRVLSLKHPGFREEREWRILANFESVDPARVRFRQGQTTVVPYVELDSSEFGVPNSKLPIREVVHGPSVHSQLTSQSLVSLFKKYGFSLPEIRSSTIPFRML